MNVVSVASASFIAIVLGGLFLKMASSKSLKSLKNWLTILGIINVVAGVFLLFGVVLWLLIRFLSE